MRRLPSFVSSAVTYSVLAAMPVMAHAHAALTSSTPAANQTVSRGPLHFLLRFSSRIDGARSTVMLEDAHGATRSLVLASPDTQDALEGDAGTLQPGQYKLEWQALATDGHITRGQIPFEVR
jgi:copper resistance protein C